MIADAQEAEPLVLPPKHRSLQAGIIPLLECDLWVSRSGALDIVRRNVSRFLVFRRGHHHCHCQKVFNHDDVETAAKCWLGHAVQHVKEQLGGSGGVVMNEGEECPECGSLSGGWRCHGSSEFPCGCGLASLWVKGRKSGGTAVHDIWGERPCARRHCVHPRPGRCAWTSFTELPAARAHINGHMRLMELLETWLKNIWKRSKRLGVRPSLETEVTAGMDQVSQGIGRRLAAFKRARETCSDEALLERLSAPAVCSVRPLASRDGDYRRGMCLLCLDGSALVLQNDYEAVQGRAWSCARLRKIPCSRHPGTSCWKIKTRELHCITEEELPGPSSAVVLIPKFNTTPELRLSPGRACFKATRPCAPSCAANASSGDVSLLVSRPSADIGTYVAERFTFLSPPELRQFVRVFPLHVLWYRDARGVALDPTCLRCPVAECAGHLRASGCRVRRLAGLGLTSVFLPIVPQLRCSREGCVTQISGLHQDVERQVPVGFQLSPRCDVVGYRVYECGVSDFLCAELRRRFHRGALLNAYLQSILPTVADALREGGGAAMPELRRSVIAMLTVGVPTSMTLCNLVLLVFQKNELPRIDEEVQAVCGRFAATIATDSSSAPLHEVGHYSSGKQPGNEKVVGAATASLGLFDVPLHPYIVSTSENTPSNCTVVAYCVKSALGFDPECFPIGWVDDNTQSNFELTCRLIEKLGFTFVQAGEIDIVYAEKRVVGFFRGIDPKHVEWRLQDLLDGASADFVRAAFALRILVSRLFNTLADDVEVAVDAEVADGSDGDVEVLNIPALPAPLPVAEAWRLWIQGERAEGTLQDQMASESHCLSREKTHTSAS